MMMKAIGSASRKPLFVIISISIIPRVIFSLPHYWIHPDEVFQYIEPAYAIDFGRGIVTWEYRLGMRSWFVPSLLAPSLWLGKALLGSTELSMLPMRLFLVVFSLSIVYSSVVISRQLSNLHAWLAGLAMALTFEPILFASRAMTESIATNFFFLAFVFLTNPKEETRAPSILIGGLCLGLALATRLQFAPAIALAAICYSRLQLRSVALIALGGAMGLSIASVFDLLHGEYPLQWMVENLKHNLLMGESERYGVSPYYFYVSYLKQNLGFFWTIFIGLIIIAARRFPIIAAIGLTDLISHSLIGHKEPRFIFLAISIFTFLAAIGTADVLNFMLERQRSKAIIASIALFFIWTGCTMNWAYESIRNGRLTAFELIGSWRILHNIAGMCGLASLTSGDDIQKRNTPTSYAYIDRDIPIYMFVGDNGKIAFSRKKGYFNVVLAGEDFKGFLKTQGFGLKRCVSAPDEQGADFVGTHAHCIFIRVGSCDSGDSGYYIENEVRRRMKL